MAVFGWTARLREAQSVEALMGLCVRYVELLPTEELDDMPTECRPPLLCDSAQITSHAIRLIQFSEIGDRGAHPALRPMTSFFTRAALRLAELQEMGRR
jgi:hypothetical protein